MCHISVLILILVISEYFVICCRSGYDYSGNDPENQATTTTKKPPLPKDDLERNSPSAWGGFEVPDDMKKEWREWLNEYKENRTFEAQQKGGSAYDRETGNSLPYEFEGFGPGYAGSPPDEPPPWAYVPVNIGLPLYCYDSPLRGRCADNITRYAFNPYTQQCTAFEYSGCGGNQNNFIDELKCIEKCITPPPSGCDPKTDIYIEDYTIMENRRKNVRKCGYF